MTEKNPWKIATIILIIISLILGVVLIQGNNTTYKFEGFQIKKATLNDLYENYAPAFLICDLNKQNCIDFHKISP